MPRDSAASPRAILPPAPARPRYRWLAVLLLLVLATVLTEVAAQALEKVFPSWRCTWLGCWKEH